MNRIQYRITTWQDNYELWHWVITKYQRVRFKRSGRVGWRKLGFVQDRPGWNTENLLTRAEALKAAQAARKAILNPEEV